MRNAGFTLIEMMIVVVILGLVAVFALPKLAATFGKRSTRTAADQFVLAHSVARATAVRYGRVAELHIDAGNARFWVEVDTSQAGGVRDTVGPVNVLGEGAVTITSNRTLLCFDSRGLPTTRGACEVPSATVDFSLSGNVSTVNVSALGKVLR